MMQKSRKNAAFLCCYGERKGAVAMKKLVLYLTVFILLFAACAPKTITPADTHADSRTKLILATDSRNAELTAIVSNFNANNPDYRVSIVLYGTPEKPMENLLTEIISGQGPDILAFYSSLATVNDNIYEDLLPYLDADPEYSRETIIPSLLNASIVDGKLSHLVFDFLIWTFVADERIVGERTSITMEEAREFASSMGEGVPIFPAWMDSEIVLGYITAFSINSYIDPANGTCSFDNPDFVALLEASVTHTGTPPEEIRYNEKELLSNFPFQNLELLQNLQNRYGTEYAFVGFPSSDACGSTIEVYNRFAISALSKQKDAAWLFLRSTLSAESQGESWYFTSTQAELDRRLAIALEGDPVTQFKIEPEEAEKFLTLLNSITVVGGGTNPVILDIIGTEAQSLFAGEKTAEEVAQIIQSRVSLVLSERGSR